MLPGNISKKSLDIIAIILSVLSFLYAVISSEYGPFINKAKISFFPTNKYIEFSQNYGSLNIKYPLTAVKTGKGSISVSKIIIYLQRIDGNYQRVFDWNQSIATYDNNISTDLNLLFSEEVNMKRWSEGFKKTHIVKSKIMEQYKKDKNPFKAYFLTNDNSVLDLKKYVSEQLRDFEASDYQFLIAVYKDPKDVAPIWKEAYSFSISQDNAELLKEYQLASYDSDSDFNPKYITYITRSFVTALSAEKAEQLLITYNSYSNKKL